MNSIQGHHHSSFGVEYYSDKGGNTRWSMTVGCLLDPTSPAARYASGMVLKRPILGCGIIAGGDKDVLVISDMHLPYQHPDALDFLQALEDEFVFDQILNVGDLYDHHRGSYHESEPDAYGEEEEFDRSKKLAHVLQEMFPDMDIVKGNHDAIPQRKLKTCGLPTSALSDFNKMYDTEDSWRWHREFTFDSGGGYPVVVPMSLNKKGRWDKTIIRV
jgi:hypothetical protein